jgi:enoyl-CoA hydratase/carnithine racemase
MSLRASINLGDLLKGYERKLKADETAKLKLVDSVVVKKQLKDKLIKEIQGFRTRPTAYQALSGISQKSLKETVDKVKAALNYK